MQTGPGVEFGNIGEEAMNDVPYLLHGITQFSTASSYACAEDADLTKSFAFIIPKAPKAPDGVA